VLRVNRDLSPVGKRHDPASKAERFCLAALHRAQRRKQSEGPYRFVDAEAGQQALGHRQMPLALAVRPIGECQLGLLQGDPAAQLRIPILVGCGGQCGLQWRAFISPSRLHQAERQ
jgi:hypothetical protein